MSKAKGIIDRITDGEWATILVEDEGLEFVVGVNALPVGATEGTWVTVLYEGTNATVVGVDEVLTRDRRKLIRDKARKLKKRKGSKYKKN